MKSFISNVKLAKNLLLNKNCYECKFAKDIWLLADDELKCKKTKEINHRFYSCHKWKIVSNDNLYDRDYYREKYIRDREFFARINETIKILKKFNNEKMKEDER